MNRNNGNKTVIILTLLGIVIALFISVLVFVQSTVSTAIPSITPTKVPVPPSVNVKPYVITTSDMTSDAAEKVAIAKGY